MTLLSNISAARFTREGQQLFLPESLSRVVRINSRELHTISDGAHGYAIKALFFEMLEREWIGETRPADFTGPRYGPFDGPTAGLEAAYRFLAAQIGHQLAPLTPRPVGRREVMSDGLPTNEALLRFVEAHDRGVLRFVPGVVDQVHCLAAICLAFREARIAVVVATKRARHAITRSLCKLGVPITEVKKGHGDRFVSCVCVSKPYDLEESGVECAHLNLVVVLNAEEAAGEEFQLALNSCNRARMFALLDADRKVAPRNRDRMAATFGFAVLTLTGMNTTARPVEVACLDHHDAAGLRDVESEDIRKQFKLGIWQNRSRNRRVLKLARQLTSPEGLTVRRQLFGDRGTEPLRTVVMAAVDGHVVEILKHHPRFRKFEAPRSCFGQGLRLTRSPDSNVIITTSSASKFIDWESVDALVWIGAGDEGPPLSLEMLACSFQDLRPLLLVDVGDSGHPLLETMTHHRRRGYGWRDWNAVGEDPVEARVKRFIAEKHREVATR